MSSVEAVKSAMPLAFKAFAARPELCCGIRFVGLRIRHAICPRQTRRSGSIALS